LSPFLCVVLSFVTKGLAMGRSPAHGVMPKRQKVFIVSEVNFESENVRGLNQRDELMMII
jgi:hypothetical protein